MCVAASNGRSLDMKILIVDDHKVVRDGIRFMLSDAPDIDIVGDAESAEAMFESPNSVSSTFAVKSTLLPTATGFGVAVVFVVTGASASGP